MTLEDRRAQQILRAYGGWALRDIIIDPDAGISGARTSFYGCTHYVVNGEAHFMQTTAKGIQLGHRGESIEILPWAQVKSIARAVDPFLLGRIEEHRVRSRLYTQARPAFAPTEEELAVDADLWAGSAFKAWSIDHDALEDEQERLLDEALPLAATTTEPTDLLELLALGGAA